MDEVFELERIDGHVIDDYGSVSYVGIWKFWPPSSASLLSADELKESQDLLRDYHQSLGISDDYSEEEKLLKLTSTALKEMPKLNKKVWVTEVIGHSTDSGGELSFHCRFNTGELVCARPRHSFLAEFEKETLQTYIDTNIPSSSSSITPPSRTAKRTRPTRTPTNGSFRFSPTFESMSSSEVKKFSAGPAGNRSRSPSLELLSEDSDASVMTTKKSKRNTRSSIRKRQPPRKGSDGSSGSSTTPRNTRGNAAAKRTATGSTAQVVVQKKVKTEPGYSNKVLQSIYKDENGVLQILTKNDMTGELTVQELDDSFQENPSYTYQSLKYLFSQRLGNA